jgi:hypothetical protein
VIAMKSRARGDGARVLAAALLAEVTWLAVLGRVPLDDVREVRRFVLWFARAARRWRSRR